MSPRTLWLRVGALTALAAGLFAVLAPPRPPARLGPGLAVLPGTGVGIALFLVVARRAPVVRLAAIGAAGLAARCVLGLLAAEEEVLWRRVALGELLVAGPVAALAVSSVAFGLAHRASRSLHVATGAAFGCAYLLTGALAASVAAHWTYNLLLATQPGRRPRSLPSSPT